MRKLNKIIQILLAWVLLIAVVPSTRVHANEIADVDNQAQTIRLYYTDESPEVESLKAYVWGEENLQITNEGLTFDTPLSFTKEGEYPHTDIKMDMSQETGKLGLILLNNDKKLINEDTFVDVDRNTTELWVNQKLEVTKVAPTPITEVMHIGIKDEGINKDTITLWTWDDFHSSVVGSDWNTDRLKPNRFEDGFIYFDVPLAENAKKIGFLFHYGDGQSSDYRYQLDEVNRNLYTAKRDPNIYHNMNLEGYTVNGARWIEQDTLQIDFGKQVDSIDTALIKLFEDDMEIPYTFKKNYDRGAEVTIDHSFDASKSYEITYDGRSKKVITDWKLIDQLYSTQQELGIVWNNGMANARLWSPSAQAVEMVVYDKADQNIEVGRASLSSIDNVWSLDDVAGKLGLASVENYYYQYAITRGDETVYVLDPYAKSMASWNGLNRDACTTAQASCVAKAAFVNVEAATSHLDYANLGDSYTGSHDAIIYEVHVRDFTSDKDLEGLNSPFGTFDAFIEKLPYLKSLGVTHIQLLPLMSYFNINEANRGERVWDYTKQGVTSNYNWGYDPQSYFALSGVYSQNPDDASLRLQEFARLVDAIHDSDMGVIMDVVYNHTADVSIFEDIQPNYYHFMDAAGNSKTSFGGGRLGTTHAMSRRVLVDSIEYWTKNFKIDGFRFDMMGDHDAESIEIAHKSAKALNPNILFLGEGWSTYAGDDFDQRVSADQQWVKDYNGVGVFSDEVRNELKSGFGSEGQPMFLTGGKRNVQKIFNNIKA